MNVKVDFCTREHELAGIGAHELSLFTNSPFHEQPTPTSSGYWRGACNGLSLLKGGRGVVDNLSTLHGRRTHLSRSDPPCLGKTCGHERFKPGILSMRVHAVRAT